MLMAMQHHSKPLLVCFDLGGVIVRICRTWEEGCARAGLPLRGMEQRDASRSLRSAAVLEYQTGRIDDGTFSHRISAALGGAYTPAEVMAVHRAWVIEEYPGVVELIDSLHDSGFETAALSNTNSAHWAQIQSWTAVRRIQRPRLSHIMGLHKPDQAIYRAFEASVGRRPEEILFFDDLPENVESARASGWQAHRIDPSGDPAEQVRRAVGG
jgi:putative hydrolase of the HAD superfamily